MDERGFKLVNMFINKYNFVYSISVLRPFYPFILKINIQNYCSKNASLVDFFLEISKKNVYLFFSLISKNIMYNYEQLINMSCVDNINLQSYHLTAIGLV